MYTIHIYTSCNIPFNTDHAWYCDTSRITTAIFLCKGVYVLDRIGMLSRLVIYQSVIVDNEQNFELLIKLGITGSDRLTYVYWILSILPTDNVMAEDLGIPINEIYELAIDKFLPNTAALRIYLMLIGKYIPTHRERVVTNDLLEEVLDDPELLILNEPPFDVNYISDSLLSLDDIKNDVCDEDDTSFIDNNQISLSDLL